MITLERHKNRGFYTTYKCLNAGSNGATFDVVAVTTDGLRALFLTVLQSIYVILAQETVLLRFGELIQPKDLGLRQQLFRLLRRGLVGAHPSDGHVDARFSRTVAKDAADDQTVSVTSGHFELAAQTES